MSHAARLEQKISSFRWKCLYLHKSTSSLCFYLKASPCPLPINSLTSIFKSAKISGHLLLCDSQDPPVQIAYLSSKQAHGIQKKQ